MKEAPKLLKSGISFTKGDFWAAAIVGELVAWLLFIMAQVNARDLPLPRGLIESLTSPWLLADRKSTRLNSSHIPLSRMPSSA